MIDDPSSESSGPSLTEDMLIAWLLSSSRPIILDTLVSHAIHSTHHRLQDMHRKVRRKLEDPQVRSNHELFALLMELARDLEGFESDLNDMFRFSRKQGAEDSLLCDAHSEIKRVIGVWISYLNQRKCKLTLRLDAHDTGTQITHEQLQEIISVLLVNSIDAYSTSISITTENKTDWQVSSIFTLRYGLNIQVEDNGCGFAGENPEIMFEPTYTTKTHPRGAGLGLFVARSLARQAGGELSYVGGSAKRGAVFSIVLPIRKPKRY